MPIGLTVTAHASPSPPLRVLLLDGRDTALPAGKRARYPWCELHGKPGVFDAGAERRTRPGQRQRPARHRR